ncbi:calpain-9 [Rousettus aegyptiacus]|uniref:calpain-9 n=1 Tax=Rousettus aegyptiacus TaxID=9407 RepID=UPI00168CC904|nr:calpain-9 [Rousettus aegyptiacus]
MSSESVLRGSAPQGTAGRRGLPRAEREGAGQVARLVPRDQGFGPVPGDLAAQHCFRQRGEWLDVVLDGRLPTFGGRGVFLHSAARSEFWSAWLERAYPKCAPSHRPCGLTGGYEAQTRGGAPEAMEDSRGGAAEVLAAREAPQNLYEIPEKALQKGSLLGCSFEIRNTAESEARTPFGLIKGHAYTVTGLDQVGDMAPCLRKDRLNSPGPSRLLSASHSRECVTKAGSKQQDGVGGRNL